MRKVKINGHNLEVYDGIDELPIVNFQKYNKCLLIDAGIGSDIDDVGEHIVKLAKLIGSGKDEDRKKALTELENMQSNLIMICSELSASNMAFATLVKSIDGEVVTDLSDEGLKGILDKLKQEKQSSLSVILSELKKKFSSELETYFPQSFYVDSRQKEAFDRCKNKILRIYDSIIDPDNADKYEMEIQAIERDDLDRYKPKHFIGKSSVEITYDKQFESCCVLISQKTNSNAKNMSVLQYYTTLDIIKKQVEAEQKAYNKNKRV